MRFSIILTIFSCVIVIIIAAIFIYNLQPPDLPSQIFKENLGGQAQITLDIPEKLGFNEIVEKLSAQGLIRSERAFKIYALITGRAHRFKPGRYFLNPSILAPALTKILAAGPSEISVTIYPGMTLKEIDDRLSSLKIIEPGDLINFNASSLKNDYPWLPLFENNSSSFENNSRSALEGFLLPDTYYFFPATEVDLTIKKILDNFKLRASPFLNQGVNILKTIILASLLEKEIPDNGERRIAAGILEKRLSIGMALQVDATIIYAKCDGRFSGCPALTEEDYKINSAYNTYLSPGLPPTPISNPSLEAIKAAATPLKTDYWYYLSDPETKKTIFSKTLEEHNENRVKYYLDK